MFGVDEDLAKYEIGQIIGSDWKLIGSVWKIKNNSLFEKNTIKWSADE